MTKLLNPLTFSTSYYFNLISFALVGVTYSFPPPHPPKKTMLYCDAINFFSYIQAKLNGGGEVLSIISRFTPQAALYPSNFKCSFLCSLFLSHFTFLLSNVSKMQMLLSQFSCVVPFLLPLYPRSLNSRAPVSVLLCRSILASPLSKVPNFKCSCFCSPVKFHSYLPFVQSL